MTIEGSFRDRSRLARRLIATGAIVAACLTTLAPAASAADPLAARVNGQNVYDPIDLLQPATRATAENLTDAIARSVNADVVVYTDRTATPVEPSKTEARAKQIFDAWSLGRDKPGGGFILLVTIGGATCDLDVLVDPDDAFVTRVPVSGSQDFPQSVKVLYNIQFSVRR